MKLHIIGIGGIGMKGVAEIAKAKGHIVTGSDWNHSESIEQLKEEGFQIFSGHSAENVNNVNVVVASSAVVENNPEIKQAKLLNIPIWTRMQALDRLLNDSGQRISIIGSCGKTSATAIFESVFSNIKPSVYMGAKSKITNKNGSAGDGEVSIVESCEYKGGFYDFQTDNIVLTDIIPNHEDYFGSGIELVSKTFVNFIESNIARKILLPVDIVNNKAFKNLLSENKIVTYGINSGDWQASIIHQKDFTTTFRVKYNKTEIGDFVINIPGEHLVKHAIPAIALALDFGISIDVIRKGLLDARLPNRRFDIKYQSNSYIGIDDNARNPSQLENTIKTISEHLPKHKIIAVAGIWGHLNRRPILKFAKALKDVDSVFISDVGAAARSMGGVEEDNAAEKLIVELENLGVIGMKSLSEVQIYNKVNELIKKGPVAVLTFGYDKYSCEFNKIHQGIISKLQY